jgi:hypothetical protein
MKRKRSTILMVVFGVVILIFIVGAGTATWFFLSVFESVDADEALATIALNDARAKFSGQVPILELRDDQAVILRKAPDAAPARDLQNVHALTWDAEEGKLARMVLPFWLIRLKSSPIEVAISTSGTPISLTVEEIERHGPALLLDHMEEDGSRVLVWTE